MSIVSGAARTSHPGTLVYRGQKTTLLTHTTAMACPSWSLVDSFQIFSRFIKSEKSRMPKHDAVYVRVSSRTQDTRSQLPDLRSHLSGKPEPVLWYEDKFTGKTMDRPGWRKLEAAIRRGEVRRLIVWRLDRLGRTARGLTALLEELQRRDVVLVSLREGLDLSTPAGRLMAHVLASMAQYETEVRGERVRAGQAAARAQGKRWGGSEKGRRVKVTDLHADTIRRLKAEGVAVAAIARTVGLSRPTVYSVLEGTR